MKFNVQNEQYAEDCTQYDISLQGDNSNHQESLDSLNACRAISIHSQTDVYWAVVAILDIPR